MNKSEMMREINALYTLRDVVENEYLTAMNLKADGKLPQEKESQLVLLQHLVNIILREG